MKITDVVIFRVTGRWTGPIFPLGERQARQIDPYLEFSRQSASAGHQVGDPIHALYMEIQKDENIS